MKKMSLLLRLGFHLLLFFPAFGQKTEQYQGTIKVESNIDWERAMRAIKTRPAESPAKNKGTPALYNIKTTYYLEGTGIYESSLSKVGTWGKCSDGNFVMGYDCAAIEAVHKKVNELLAKANIALVNPRDCPDKEPCVINSGVPATNSLYYRVGNIDVGVNPKSFRDRLSPAQKLIESFFLSHATLLAQGSDPQMSIPGYQAELFIHVVNNLQDHDSRTIGLFVTEGYRTYTDQKIRIPGRTYPSNASRYLILIGYDDLKNTDDVAETIAHEVGHALGLKHNDAKGNLMSTSGLGNTNLTQDQIRQMQNNISSFKQYGAGVSNQKNICVKRRY